MSDQSTPGLTSSADSPQDNAGTDRRTFIAAASASIIGSAALLTPSAAQTPASAASASGVPGNTEVSRPQNLGPRAMLDNRFPVTFADSVPKAVQVIVGYFTALSQRDLKGMAEYLHFPFASFEGVEAVLVNTPEELLAKAPPSLNMSMNPERFTDHDSYMKADCYDIFEGFEVLCMDPVVVGISMSYNRYDSNGKMLSRCDGVYSISNNEGRWAIQLMSTIFTPAMQVGIVYPDAVNAANRLRIDGDMAFQMADIRLAPPPQVGSSANVLSVVGQPWSLAPKGHAMDQFKIEGIKSRLRYSDGSKPQYPPLKDPEAYYAEYRDFFRKNGVGGFGWVFGILPNSRILHQTFNKVHQFTGAVRFNPAGELASYNTDIGVITYKLGRWGNSGILCYTTPHDRSNDVLRA